LDKIKKKIHPIKSYKIATNYTIKQKLNTKKKKIYRNFCLERGYKKVTARIMPILKLNHIFYKIKHLYQKMDLQFALKGALAAGIALILGKYVSFLFKQGEVGSIVGGLWTAIAAIITSQVHLGSSFKAGGARILGTVVGAVISTIFIYFFGKSPLMFGVCIFFTIIFCKIFNLQTSISLAGATVAAIIVLNQIHEETTWKFAAFRILDTCVGVFVAISIAYLLWPKRATTKMSFDMANLFKCLSTLYKQVHPRTQQDKEDQEILIVEKEIEEKLFKNRLFLEDVKIELLMTHHMADTWEHLHFFAYKIYDCLISISTIKMPEESEIEQVIIKTGERLASFSALLNHKKSASEVRETLPELHALTQSLKQLNERTLAKDFGQLYLWRHLHLLILEAMEGSVHAIAKLKNHR